jgi:hypothetical protein
MGWSYCQLREQPHDREQRKQQQQQRIEVLLISKEPAVMPHGMRQSDVALRGCTRGHRCSSTAACKCLTKPVHFRGGGAAVHSQHSMCCSQLQFGKGCPAVRTAHGLWCSGMQLWQVPPPPA